MYYYVPEMSRRGQSIERESKLVAARGCGEGGIRGVLFGDENILELDSGSGCRTL